MEIKTFKINAYLKIKLDLFVSMTIKFTGIRLYKSSADPPIISETTLGETDCAILRECAFDLRCAVSRLWVQSPYVDGAHDANIQVCVDDLLCLANRICSVASKTSAPSKECKIIQDI